MFLEWILLVAGFAVLIKGADWLVNGSSSLARKANISELTIGLTIVAFGTSAPELVVNLISSVKGLSDMSISNVVGSNIFNLLLILGFAGLVYPLSVQNKTTWKEIPFSLLAALIVLFLINDKWLGGQANVISRTDSLILLGFFALFMLYISKNLRNSAEKTEEEDPLRYDKPWKLWALIALGLAGLIIGSKLVVDNAVSIAKSLNWSEKLIGLTIVSAGTSLPELVTSVVAATRKKTDIAVGNVIGSNIFNLFLILGISGLVNPIRVNLDYNIDLLVLSLATLLLFLAMFSGKKYKLDRWEAALLLAGYGAYLFWQLSVI